MIELAAGAALDEPLKIDVVENGDEDGAALNGEPEKGDAEKGEVNDEGAAEKGDAAGDAADGGAEGGTLVLGTAVSGDSASSLVSKGAASTGNILQDNKRLAARNNVANFFVISALVLCTTVNVSSEPMQKCSRRDNASVVQKLRLRQIRVYDGLRLLGYRVDVVTLTLYHFQIGADISI